LSISDHFLSVLIEQILQMPMLLVHAKIIPREYGTEVFFCNSGAAVDLGLTVGARYSIITLIFFVP
jgi:hypothetical protein